MAISDAYVMAMCDGGNCRTQLEVQLPFRYGGLMHTAGGYDHHEHTVERLLRKEYLWVIESGKHYCCRECAEYALREARHG